MADIEHGDQDDDQAADEEVELEQEANPLDRQGEA
jgi:hypothetical protein